MVVGLMGLAVCLLGRLVWSYTNTRQYENQTNHSTAGQYHHTPKFPRQHSGNHNFHGIGTESSWPGR